MTVDHKFVDFYDVLQVSPNADTDTIRRVFRHLAKKCHPDLQKGGDPERFHLLLKAHDTLTNPEKRVAYDVRYEEYWSRKWQILNPPGSGASSAERTEIRERMLSLFYVQRRTTPREPGLGDLEISRLLRLPIEFIEFELWYLRQKGWVERLETGLLAISVDGVDQVERTGLRLSEERLLEGHSEPTKTADSLSEP